MPLDPSKTELLWIDIETTGLHLDWHELIQLGISLSDWEGNFKHYRTEISFTMRHPERLVPVVKEMHLKSGLLGGDDKENPWVVGGRSIPDGQIALREWSKPFLRDIRGTDRKIVLAGHNISNFDLRFLEHNGFDLQDLWPSVFDYHVMDIWPLIVTLFGAQYGKLELAAEYLGLSQQTHTALNDAELACRVYQKLRPMIVELQASRQEGES